METGRPQFRTTRKSLVTLKLLLAPHFKAKM